MCAASFLSVFMLGPTSHPFRSDSKSSCKVGVQDIVRRAPGFQFLNSGVRLPMFAIMDSCRSLLMSMAAFQVAT